MDRNTIIGLVLIFALFVGFTLLNQPSKEEIERRQRVQDSLVQVRWQQDSVRQADFAKKQLQIQNTESADASTTPDKQALKEKVGVFSNSVNGEKKYFILENKYLKVKLSAKGGKIVNVRLKDYETFDSLPLNLFNNENTRFGYTFFSNNRIINTNDLYFQPYYPTHKWQGKDSIFISENDSVSFAMRLYADLDSSSFNPNKYIEYVYTLYGEKYMTGYTLNIVGMNDVVDPGTSFFDLAWEADLRRQEKNVQNERNESTVFYKYDKDEVDYLKETKDGQEKLVTPVKWISFKTQFFLATIIGNEAFSNAEIKTFTDLANTDRHYNKSVSALIAVPVDNLVNESIPMRMYFGPNKYSTLKKFHLDLERQIYLGWSFFLMAWINIYAVIPVFDWLGGYGWNYGIVILILTILLKIVLFPIAYKTYTSSAKMRVLKPEVDELSKKFPKPEDAMKKQQAIMGLYKKAGVNPMAGCVPMLLQFPILIAMFRFFPSSIELRQQSFLWAHDLSSYDSVLNLPFNIPFYGDHVSLFTLLMTISTIFYTKISNDMMGSTSTQMPGMKTMMYIMPVMFLGIFNNYASGLSYYYLLANLLTFAQMWLIRRTINEDKIHAQIQENKKKPVKKSGWQQRLEEMAKQRGYNPNVGKKK